MAIDNPVSDTSRAIQHEPDRSWPSTISIELRWRVGGATLVTSAVISSDQFYGRGEFGAPLSGDALIGMIEHMRRAGPPSLGKMKVRNPDGKSRKR